MEELRQLPGAPRAPSYPVLPLIGGGPPPPGAQLPSVYPYTTGTYLPAGYHVEERPRTGAVITGYSLLLPAYAIVVLLSAQAEFDNGTGWTLVPALGPWLALGAREDRCTTTPSGYEECSDDSAVQVGLAVDGLVQIAGAVLLMVGYNATKTWVVQDGSVALSVAPRAVGSGYGAALGGSL